jgi:hypothetical protein
LQLRLLRLLRRAAPCWPSSAGPPLPALFQQSWQRENSRNWALRRARRWRTQRHGRYDEVLAPRREWHARVSSRGLVGGAIYRGGHNFFFKKII